MKTRTITLLSISALLTLSATFLGCTAFKNGAPPTKTEQALFSVQTNYVPVVVVTTNQVAGQPPILLTTTNLQPTYTYTPGPTITAAQGASGLIPGYGTLVGTGIGALAALWSWFRSSKKGVAVATLAQGIETSREFLKTLPNGAAYDNALTKWLSDHQKETGTVDEVVSVLENEVSNADAQVAAQQIRATIAALNPQALPPKTP